MNSDYNYSKIDDLGATGNGPCGSDKLDVTMPFYREYKYMQEAVEQHNQRMQAVKANRLPGSFDTKEIRQYIPYRIPYTDVSGFYFYPTGN